MELAIKRGHDVSLDNSSVGSSECALWVCDGSSQSNNQTGWEVKIEVNDQEGDYAVAGETAALAPPDDAKTLELVRELESALEWVAADDFKGIVKTFDRFDGAPRALLNSTVAALGLPALRAVEVLGSASKLDTSATADVADRDPPTVILRDSVLTNDCGEAVSGPGVVVTRESVARDARGALKQLARVRTALAERSKAPASPREGEDEEAAKDPHPVKTGAAQSAASAVVCFVIYFFFCIVFASVVFDPLVSPSDPPFGVAQGVGVNLLGIAIGSLFFSRLSGCKAVIGGPDLLPIIFAAECGTAVTAYLEGRSADDGGDGYGDGGNGYGDGDASGYGDDSGGGSYGDGAMASSHERRLGGDEPKLDASARAMVIPTTLVAMMIGNLLTGLLFVTLGKMNSTSAAIGFIPSSVISGFL